MTGVPTAIASRGTRPHGSSQSDGEHERIGAGVGGAKPAAIDVVEGDALGEAVALGLGAQLRLVPGVAARRRSRSRALGQVAKRGEGDVGALAAVEAAEAEQPPPPIPGIAPG